MGKKMMIFSIVTSLITMFFSGLGVFDQIKNGNKRAELQGRAAGEAIVREGEKRGLHFFKKPSKNKKSK